MKKEYRAPYLAMESFQLDAAIAVNCSKQQASNWGTPLETNKAALGWAAESCAPAGEGVLIAFFGDACMMDGRTDCVPSPEEIESNDYFCYQAPFWYLDVAINS